MTHFVLACPGCSQQNRAPVGKMIRCAKCKRPFTGDELARGLKRAMGGKPSSEDMVNDIASGLGLGDPFGDDSAFKDLNDKFNKK